MPREAIPPQVHYPHNDLDRAVWYGDGFFETIILGADSKPEDYPRAWLLPHWVRMTKSCSRLRLEWPEMLPESYEGFEEVIWKQFYEFQSVGHPNNQDPLPLVRLRLLVCRAPGGLYTPKQMKSVAKWDIGLASRNSRLIACAEVSHTVVLAQTKFETIKSLSALPYVMAAMEREERGQEELLIANGNGLYAEACAANLIWYEGGTWYTTDEDSGAIMGTMQERVIAALEILTSENVTNTGDVTSKVLRCKGMDPERMPLVGHLLLTNANGVAQVLHLSDGAGQYDFDLLPPDYFKQLIAWCAPHQLSELG